MKKLKQIKRQAITLFAAVAMTMTPAALAADYPDRPIGLMVAYGAGGATDFQARIVAMMSEKEDYLGQPIYVINRPAPAAAKDGINSCKKPSRTAMRWPPTMCRTSLPSPLPFPTK